MAAQKPFKPPPKFSGELSSYEPGKPSDRLRRGILSMFAGEADPVTRQSRTDTVEKLVNLSALPWLADVGYSAGQAVANPKTRKRNLKDLSWAAIGAFPGLRKKDFIKRFRGVKDYVDQFKGDDFAKANQARDTKNWVETELPINELYATQDVINPNFAEVSVNRELPTVYKKGGDYFVYDGHHRLVNVSEQGFSKAKVNLIDLD